MALQFYIGFFGKGENDPHFRVCLLASFTFYFTTLEGEEKGVGALDKHIPEAKDKQEGEEEAAAAAAATILSSTPASVHPYG